MKLTYRGLSYDFKPQLVKMKNTKILVKYRGSSYLLMTPVMTSNQSPLNLTYRGISYNRNPHKLSNSIHSISYYHLIDAS